MTYLFSESESVGDSDGKRNTSTEKRTSLTSKSQNFLSSEYASLAIETIVIPDFNHTRTRLRSEE